MNTNASTLTLAGNEVVKTYKFSDIRSWALKNLPAGLFIQVRDTEYPEYRILMHDEITYKRWFEILTQALNEGGVSQ